MTAAIKMFIGRKEWKDWDYNEAVILKELDHPNIIKVYEVCKTANNYYIIMEFANGGTLKDFLDNITIKMDEWRSSQMILEIINALIYLNTKGITHQDLHDENIMLGEDDNKDLVCKIIDFGCAETKDNPVNDIVLIADQIRRIVSKTEFSEDTCLSHIERVCDQMTDGLYDNMSDVLNALSLHCRPLSHCRLEKQAF